jgi:hypothetical protein
MFRAWGPSPSTQARWPWQVRIAMAGTLRRGAYRLKDMKTGKDEGNPWNVEQL